MFDTHCHLNFDAFEADRNAVISSANALGVTRILIPAVDLATSQEAIALATQHTGIYSAVGVHPNSTTGFSAETVDTLRTLAKTPKVVAIGEIGLDYYWQDSPHAVQASAFDQQLALATELELPVIIHDRDAHADVIRHLEAWSQTLPESLKGRAGVLHSCSAPLDIVERALAIGFYIGFTGPITFKKADDLRRVASAIPLERLLVETDAPFLTPEPYRGKRNSPAYIPHIVDRLAVVKGISTPQLAHITTENALRLFAI